MWQILLSIVVGIGLASLLVRQYLRARAQQVENQTSFIAQASSVVNQPSVEAMPGNAYARVSGIYGGCPVQIQPVVDTLAVRKVPALWLLVTLQDDLPVRAKFDMMMRPTGPTSFSNFDHLPHTLPRPNDFPEEAVIRTDDPEHVIPAFVVAAHLAPFDSRRAKELLITPNGLRIVWLLAEGDRARYGVFRQADFGDISFDKEVLTGLLDHLVALRQSILDWHDRAP